MKKDIPSPQTTPTQPGDPADLETRDMLLNVGPAHPAMHGIIRIVAKLDGEQIEDVEVEIGYLHRGFEKMAETVDYNGVMPYTDRLNYVSPLINNMGYCMAVEKLLGISVPERCHYVRVILSEISRISDHLTCVGATAMELGAFSVFLYMIKAREYLWELVEKVTGARLTVSYCRVGGVKGDLPDDFAEPCRKAFEETRKVLVEADGLLTRNRIFTDPHERNRRDLRGGRDRVRNHRPVPSSQRLGLRRAQGLPVRRLRPNTFRRARGQQGRQHGSLPGTHGRDATVHAHRGAGTDRHPPRSGHGQPRRRDARSRPPRW